MTFVKPTTFRDCGYNETTHSGNNTVTYRDPPDFRLISAKLLPPSLNAIRVVPRAHIIAIPTRRVEWSEKGVSLAAKTYLYQ